MQLYCINKKFKSFNLKWLLFPYLSSDFSFFFFFFKINKVRPVDDIDKLKMATFPLMIVPFFFFFLKTNKVQAVDDKDKLCKFHENLTTNADYIA